MKTIFHKPDTEEEFKEEKKAVKTFQVTEYEAEVLRFLKEINKNSKRTANNLSFLVWLIIVGSVITAILISNNV